MCGKKSGVRVALAAGFLVLFVHNSICMLFFVCCTYTVHNRELEFKVLCMSPDVVIIFLAVRSKVHNVTLTHDLPDNLGTSEFISRRTG
jgi:hypothetical protein